jgi:hypothetical protein
MFRQEFRLGVLRGAERTLPPWLKVPAKRPQSKSVKTNKIAPEIASQHNPDDLFEQAQSAEEHGDIAEAERLKTVLPP